MNLKHVKIAFVAATAVAVAGIAYKFHTEPVEQPEPVKAEEPAIMESTPKITIHREEIVTDYEETIPFREEEIDLMARVVQAEYGNGDETDKRLVVSVILNRLEDSDFPGTIYGVVTQPSQFVIAQWATVETFSAVYKEIRDRTDTEILWFCAGEYPKWGIPAYERNNHYFSRKKREGER